MDTDRLKATWQEVAQHGDDVPSYFYAHLFVTHPELRAMFPLVMSAQRDRLVGALGRVVSSVDDLGSVVPFVQQLGRDHRRFSVVAEHYDAVGASCSGPCRTSSRTGGPPRWPRTGRPPTASWPRR